MLTSNRLSICNYETQDIANNYTTQYSVKRMIRFHVIDKSTGDGSLLNVMLMNHISDQYK